jgi:endonuclease-3 related protein
MLDLNNSYELFLDLESKSLLDNSPKFWWPNAGSLEVVIGAILTQNTKWKNVEIALENLRPISIESILESSLEELSLKIRSVGFYNQKSKRIKKLFKNIKEEFNDFHNFFEYVDREWLLSQTGIGEESADAILCYGCFKEVFVVDSYTNKLLKSYGYEFETYQDIQEWCERGIIENWNKLSRKYDENLNLCFSRFHGMIVEFMKKKN